MGRAASEAGPRVRALAAALIGSSLWGVNAVAAQVIFETYSFSPLLLAAIRMPLAGLLLLVIFRPDRPRSGLRAFAAFAVVGLWLVQYTYLLTIATSNAATATLLQFLALPMIAAFEIAASRARVTLAGVAAVVVACLGTAELVAGRSNGSLALLVTPFALTVGLVSAAAAAYYIVRSKPLIKQYGSVRVATWGFLFGSVVAIPAGLVPFSGASPSHSPPPGPGGPVEFVALILFVVVFGTLLSFLFYFKGLERITPIEAGIAAAMEPIAAAVVAFFVLHVVLTPFQYLGGLLIVGAVVLIVLKKD